MDNLLKSEVKLFLILLMVPAIIFAQKPKYSFKVKVNGLKDTVCYLGHYYGDKQYIKDTAKVDSKGNFEFSGEDALPGGIYLIIVPAKKYFEIIVDRELFFSIETDTSDFVGKMKIKGSTDNKLFYDYLNYINQKQKEAAPLSNALKKFKENKDSLTGFKDNKDSIKLIKDKLSEIDSEVKKYKLDYIDANSGTFLAKVFKASYEPEIPEAPLLPNGRKDSNYVYKQYKKHFLDNIDFSDDRLLRTPVFHNKIKQYITTLVVQIPDSINKEADSLIEKARANKEVFKYVVWFLTNWSETSEIMGFDAIFVHLVEKYYMTNQAYWITPSIQEKITKRAEILKNILIGVKPPNLTLLDSNYLYISMYSIPVKYLVLLFWEPSCGHCKKEVPKLKALYDSLKSKSFEVYAVCGENKLKEWKDFIKEYNLNWINVMDMQNESGFRTTYDIYSTPVIYLLDENKKILAKRLNVDQLRGFMERILKKEEQEKEKKK